MAFATLLVRSRHRLSQIQGWGHVREARVSGFCVLAAWTSSLLGCLFSRKSQLLVLG